MLIERQKCIRINMLEIEAKVRVADLDAVRARLKARGSRLSGRSVERDVYYNAPHRDFGETDEALRMRYAGSSCVVTYKGPKRPGSGLKVRDELNVGVEPGGEFEQILRNLGFRAVHEVVKTREVYAVPGATVMLDEVEDLGSFVEIEASAGLGEVPAADRVNRLVEELGLPKEYVPLSYLELALARDRASPG
ncbi:MAG: class IV adenylate cyclase [Methanomicrobiales archaeon]|nr:class IV adenylate cyclase [Methanomicrobiales archaeon]